MLNPLLLTKNGVHEQHFSSVHIRGELGIVDLSFLCLLIALDEDLAYADGAAAVPETLLHGLTCEKTTVFSLGNRCDVCITTLPLSHTEAYAWLINIKSVMIDFTIVNLIFK